MEHFSQKCNRLANLMQSKSPKELYHFLVSQEFFPENIVLNSKPSFPLNEINWENGMQFTENMMMTDFITYLPDDILTKVDRASMSVSLEARVPLLDKDVLKFAWSLPLSFKKTNEGGKDILKKVLYQYVPKELIDRPKMGFGVPIGSWLRGPLKDWANTLLDPKNITEDGFLNAQLVEQKWQQHLNSNSNQHEYYLWNIIVFQNWLKNYRRRKLNL